MDERSEFHVGLDVHEDSITVAVANRVEAPRG